MPELPELQAHAERLDADLAGIALERFEPLTFMALKTAVPDPRDAVGHVLVGAGRRGKYLLLDFSTLTFVIHLMQGGRLRQDSNDGKGDRGRTAAKPSARPPKGALARWRFEDGSSLLLTEAGTERRAGVWAVAGDPLDQPPLDDLGPDADQVDAVGLLGVLHEHPMRLHGFLRDQRALAGVGRRLANEICHRARLSPFASTAKLDSAEAERLVEAIGGAVAESLDFERSRADMSKSADRPGNVHHREGEACPGCGDTVRAVEYRAYTVNYCPRCQTGGKVLADNTTSKFLR